MRCACVAAVEPVVLAPDQAFAGFRDKKGLSPELRATVLFAVAPLGWLIWAGFIYGVKALLF